MGRIKATLSANLRTVITVVLVNSMHPTNAWSLTLHIIYVHVLCSLHSRKNLPNVKKRMLIEVGNIISERT